jgi:hypothetical protein
MKPESKACWDSLKALALDLDLPGVSEAASGGPALKAHGRLWVWWSPHEDAPVFKVPFEEREFLIEADPDTFFFTPHYRDYPHVLVRPEKLDPDWARANLIRVWRAQAPKRLLKAYDAAQAGGSPLTVGARGADPAQAHARMPSQSSRRGRAPG